MGECYSKRSVAPGSVTPERSSIQSGSSESDTRLEHKGLQESLDPGQTAFALAQLESLEICLKEAEEKAKVLSKQLAVSEGTKLKLLERVSWLEKKLEALDHKETSGEPYEKIVHLKDQKLEHKKKVEKLQTDLAIAKQEAAITALELSEEIKMLREGKPAPRGIQVLALTDVSYRLMKGNTTRDSPGDSAACRGWRARPAGVNNAALARERPLARERAAGPRRTGSPVAGGGSSGRFLQPFQNPCACINPSKKTFQVEPRAADTTVHLWLQQRDCHKEICHQTQCFHLGPSEP
ncbi:coiled-coil domain-containing protein 192 isoform X2 [Oryctolagus cuniculus]|uniref:coiled-coil domain-containing protein 192 isoform X2 n=1 Tax=Oryctolagus cuniculus TaxID=9986 RepID=UPI00223116E6|nr:coiled-coil domain-containing protein 192 isoform X2 [Oryctolagus cuniculus]